MNMKILCVIDSLCFGGAQRQLVELAFAFKEKGHCVTFLTYHHIPFYNAFVEDKGISIKCIDEPNYIKRLLKMRSYIRKGNYDAVLSFLEAANFICECAGFPYRRWRLIVGERSANPGILMSFKLICYRWFHFFADYVVANSETNMKLVRRVNPLLPKSKCVIIYNTVNFSNFKPLNHTGIKKNGQASLVIAARIQYEKNIQGLIEALSRFDESELSHLKIDWYGDNEPQKRPSPLFKKSMAEIEKKGLEKVLVFHNATHEINKVLQESDAVCLFSLYEGFPNIICEAMACEKPVICTKVSDMTCFLSHEPNLLCDPEDPDSIRNTIRYFLSLNKNQRLEIGIKNRKIALEKFNKEIIVSRYLELMGYYE